MTIDVSRRSLLTLGGWPWCQRHCSAAAPWRALPSSAPRRPTGTASFSAMPKAPSSPTARFPLGDPSFCTFTGVPKEEVKKMLADNFLSPDNVVLDKNSPIVNTGDKLILFDTGMGSSKLFGATTGRQQKSMTEAGIKPGDIDAVVCSHAHIDHIGGIVDEGGKPLFPNAQIYISQTDFHLSGPTKASSAATPRISSFTPARTCCRCATASCSSRTARNSCRGVQAISAPGHTVGHTIFMVSSACKSFAFMGDLSHHSVLLLERPRMEFSYDTDPKQAAELRVSNC